MKIIENENFPSERALYGSCGLHLKNCSFDGEEDGESALKESQNVRLEKCYMNLRYPLWHVRGVSVADTVMTEKCRAALWYSENITVKNSTLSGVKALRECRDAEIISTEINSAEFGWKCRGVNLKDSCAESEYFLFMSEDIRVENVKFKGKYSFQYTKNAVIENCVLDTKDAFWHSVNVTVKNCVIKGEYLAWYSENLTLETCKITGTQPLCYCKNLTLINCQMIGADLAFEYSDVNATVIGDILSVKNPHSGKIAADGIGEIILTEDSVYKCSCDIVSRK